MRSRADPLRLFFALQPPALVRQALRELQSGLGLDGRPVAEERLHLTLAFLARVPRQRVDALIELASTLEFPSCELELDLLGCFPRARVAWLGSSRLVPDLRSFQASLIDALKAAGYAPDDRPWKPHVTLYRDLRKPCRRMPLEALSWPVSGFSLVRSDLAAGGPQYRELGCWAGPS